MIPKFEAEFVVREVGILDTEADDFLDRTHLKVGLSGHTLIEVLDEIGYHLAGALERAQTKDALHGNVPWSLQKKSHVNLGLQEFRLTYMEADALIATFERTVTAEKLNVPVKEIILILWGWELSDRARRRQDEAAAAQAERAKDALLQKQQRDNEAAEAERLARLNGSTPAKYVTNDTDDPRYGDMVISRPVEPDDITPSDAALDAIQYPADELAERHDDAIAAPPAIADEFERRAAQDKLTSYDEAHGGMAESNVPVEPSAADTQVIDNTTLKEDLPFSDNHRPSKEDLPY